MRRLLKFEFVLISILFVSNTAIANRKIMLVSGYKTLVHSAEHIVQVVSNGERYVRGNTDKMKNISILNSRPSDNLAIVSIEYYLFFFPR